MTLKTNKIFPRNGQVSGANGGIIQVVQTVKTDVFTTTSVVSSGGYVDITGLSVTITPQSASNKILVDCQIYNSNGNAVNFFRLLRGSTFINQPGGTSSSGASYNAHAHAYYNCDNYQDSTSIKLLDSPATTSATTYKVQTGTTSGTCTVNAFVGTSNYYGVSTITAMEISA